MTFVGQICCLGMKKISLDLPNIKAENLPDDIHRLNQFHMLIHTIIS
jgi:hypothetical protein